MPTLPRDDRVELSAGSHPILEGRHFDLHSAPPRELGQPYVGVDPEHLTTGRLKLPGHDASTNAHVENDPSTGLSEDALDQDVGITRPGPVVTPGIGPERFRRPPLMMRLVPGNRPSLG